LAPLTTNQVNALEQLMVILHRNNKLALKPMTKHCNKPLMPAPALRVGPSKNEPQQIHPNSMPSLRVVTDQPVKGVTDQPCMIILAPDQSKVPDPMDISSDATVGTNNLMTPKQQTFVPQWITWAMNKPC